MWRFAAARTTGVSHIKSGLPCQDRFVCASVDQALVMVISDGAGSAARAEAGAEIAVQRAAAVLADHLATDVAPWTPHVIDAARAARSAVLAKSIEDGIAAREYACTLLIVLLNHDGGAALQLGDGVIAYRDHWGWAPVFWPQKGEYANTTRFLTEDDAEAAWETAELPAEEREYAVMTDGLEALALHFATRSVHEPFLEAIFKPLRAANGVGESIAVSTALEQFLRSSRISERTDDDLTLCLATPV